MNTHHTHLVSLSVDEAWIVDWAADGVLAIERYLAKHARSRIFSAPGTT
jgi:hypothetical protein